MIRGKAAEYMERAEKLKQHLAESDKANKKKPSAVGANGKVSSGSGKKWVHCLRIHATLLTYMLIELLR